MFSVSLGKYELYCQADGLPDMLSEYQKRAAVAESFGLEDASGSSDCFCAVRRRGDGWPFLVVVQRYSPSGYGFHPGILAVPETDRLFIGAGRRLLGYDLREPARLWEDEADTGFWFWSLYGELVLMAAELELAAWDTSGRKLWTRFVEPPWEFRVDGQIVVLDVMGTVYQIGIQDGKPL
jgi:hypothetical protein